MRRTVAFVTLGCKLNYAETSSIEREFLAGGFEKVAQTAPADVYVVNTCSVTEHSDKKDRNIIRRLHRQNPDARIIVTGCYAQLKPQEILNLEGVYAVLGAKDKGRAFEIATEALKEGNSAYIEEDVDSSESIFKAYSSGERTRSFLKVQDGCDYHCTYCTVPLARGRSRNVSIAEIIAQAREIAAEGIKEIVLTGVTIGDFGRTTGESFLELLRKLNEVEGIERYRISSIEPNLLTPEIVEWIASGTKFVPHFHIPLQSGCDKIALIRSKLENVFFGIDVIVGFPGETDEDFEQTYHFLEQVRPAFIHMFPYSCRANTPAAAMPDQVRDGIKTERVARLEALCKELNDEFVEQNRGRSEKVLFESTLKGGMMVGYTSNYIRIERPFDRSLIGKMAEVII